MTLAEKYINRFNQLDGKPVNKATLQEFHAQVKKANDPRLKKLEQRLAKAIDKINGHQKIAAIDPIDLKKFRKAGKKIRKVKTDSELLYGLPVNPQEASAPTGLGFTRDGQKKIYDMVTGMIEEMMKTEGLFWREPWTESKGLLSPGIYALNFSSRKMYSGINFIVLNYYAALVRKHTSPYYLTFKQAEAMGGSIRKGARALPVFYYNVSHFQTKPEKKRISETQYRALSDKEKRDVVTVPVIQYYSAFNAEDIEGISFPKVDPRKAADPIESAEAIVKNMPKRPELRHSSKREAFYAPVADYIHMPHMEVFDQEQEYYSTLFHELVHSTGHKSRIDRKFGTDQEDEYAFEELVAELGASYLNAEAGTLYFTLKSSAAYLKDWKSKVSQAMKKDNRFFLKAAAKAQAASDFILNLKEEKVAAAPKPKRKKKSPRPPVERIRRDKVTKEHPQQPVETVKPATALAGFTTADQAPETPKNLFELPGEIGKLLGKLQRYKLEIVIAGETHSSKSELGKQIANAFASIGDPVAWIDWEQGGLDSRDTVESIERNVDPENKKRFHVSGSLPRNLQAVKALAKKFKVVVLDSGTKLNQVTNAWIDQLREEEPDTVWIILMQQNVKGGTRGGTSAEFDTPIVLYTYRPDESDYKKNYAYVFKNRGNQTGIYYLIADKKVITYDPSESRDKIKESKPSKS